MECFCEAGRKSPSDVRLFAVLKVAEAYEIVSDSVGTSSKSMGGHAVYLKTAFLGFRLHSAKKKRASNRAVSTDYS